MMKLENVTFRYGEKTILENFSMELPRDGVTAVTGPSGCGKTTLLRLLGGLEKPEQGTVDCPAEVSFLFQENRLLPELTADEQIRAVLRGEGSMLQWLEAVGLKGAEKSRMSELSGGMQRRVAIARCMAFARNMRLLIMDEPFTGVDAETAGRIMRKIREMNIPVLFSAHDSESLALADRVFRFEGTPLKRIE